MNAGSLIRVMGTKSEKQGKLEEGSGNTSRVAWHIFSSSLEGKASRAAVRKSSEVVQISLCVHVGIRACVCVRARVCVCVAIPLRDTLPSKTTDTCLVGIPKFGHCGTVASARGLKRVRSQTCLWCSRANLLTSSLTS